MDAHIKAAVEKLGPPTPEQIARLRVIFWGPLAPSLVSESAAPPHIQAAA